MAQVIDVGRVIDESKLGTFHVVLLVATFFTVLVDGYDISAAAFAAPALAKEWHLRRADLGPLFSAGLFSGLFGPMIFGYFADRFGRKPATVIAVAFFGIFTLGTVWTESLTQIIVLRFIAGIGIAAVLSLVTALNNEFAPRRYRATMFILMFCGTTFGGGLGGFVVARLMPTHGWQILFWIGGIVPLVMAVVLALVLPESAKFLALRPQRHRELARLLHRIAPTLAIPPDAQFTLHGEERVKFSLGSILVGRLAWVTPLFWIVNAVNLMIFYFVSQWMPTLLSNAGVSMTQAAFATTLFQFGGTAGGLILMRPLDRWGFIPVPILFAVAIPVVACIGLPGLSETSVFALVTLAGFCLLGLQFGNLSSEGNIFPTAVRGFGVGSCFTAGRVGAVIGPLVGGFLIGGGVSLSHLFFIAAIPLFLGLAAAIAITPVYRAHYHPNRDEHVAELRVAPSKT
jgi:AAHS family 4-hydroxybenzoate transporter-like MFS transporter